MNLRSPSANSDDKAVSSMIVQDMVEDQQLSQNLNEHFFLNINWNKYFDFAKSLKKQHLGLQIISSNLLWRYLKHLKTRQTSLREDKLARID